MTDEAPVKLKDPKTFAEQVEILREKGLVIADDKKAIDILSRTNYYRLSAYALSFRNGSKYVAGTTLDTVYNLYEFDQRLRNLLMAILENIEIAMRTQIAYVHSHKYGAVGYLDPANFDKAERHAGFIDNLNSELARADELFIEHHRKKYGGQFPLWVAVEVLSFGALSRLYYNLKTEDKQHIAKTYYGIPHYYLSSWLKMLANVRNICAHYGRLYNRNLASAPRLDKDGAALSARRIFAAIYTTKKLYLDKAGWKDFVTSLQALIEAYPDVDCRLIGFCADWDKLLRK